MAAAVVLGLFLATQADDPAGAKRLFQKCVDLRCGSSIEAISAGVELKALEK